MPNPTAMRPQMADYGVPDSPEGLLAWSWAEERLTRSKNFWLVTANAQGRPHAMPVWAVWSAHEQVFWTSCSPNARKARNLAANPRCVITNDDTVEAVSVEGVGTPLADPTRRELAVSAYVAKYAAEVPEQTPEEMAEFVGSHALFEIRPERAFGMIERVPEFNQCATKWVFA